MGIVRRRIDAVAELRSLQDLAHRVWLHEPALLNFEASFGGLAWQRGGIGRCRAFERNGTLVGWARLAPGYSRIRASGVRDQAPPSLVWQVDPTDTDPAQVLDAVVDWAESRAEEVFTTAYNNGDLLAEQMLTRRGFIHDPTEPYSGYLRHRLESLAAAPVPSDYRFVTMLELDDLELRAEVHRLAWDGSTRTAADVEATMATWPYKPEFDFVAIADDGTPAASVLCWYDHCYVYGEIEPVGTVSAHHGRGIGAALIRFGLRRLRDAGVSDIVVGARADPHYPVPRRLYQSIGFTDIATQTIVRASS
jgi:GNAT superfamily N-acetyltransferase